MQHQFWSDIHGGSCKLERAKGLACIASHIALRPSSALSLIEHCYSGGGSVGSWLSAVGSALYGSRTMSKLTGFKSPVPTDIDIAQTAVPVPIADIAKDIGLQETEIDYYGVHKAKVSRGLPAFI